MLPARLKGHFGARLDAVPAPAREGETAEMTPRYHVLRTVATGLVLGLQGAGLAGCGDAPICTGLSPCPGVESAACDYQASAAAVNEPAFFASAPIPTDPGLYPYDHAATIVQLPNGDLLTAWGAGTAELAPDTVIVASRRPAATGTWTAPQVLADKPGFADANPVLFLPDADRVMLFHVEMFGSTFCEGTVVVQESTDDGLTWTAPRPALDTACVMIRNKPIITRDSRWVLPAYVQSIYQSQFWVSDDQGTTWNPTAALFTLPNNLQPACVERCDGSLLALMRTDGAGTFTWQGRSCDDAETWSLCRRPEFPNPNSGIDLIRLAGGELVFAFNDSSDARTPLSVSLSLDEGETWLPPKIVEGGDPQLSYPSLAQSGDGMIHLVYTHRLDHIQHVEFNLAWLLQPAE